MQHSIESGSPVSGLEKIQLIVPIYNEGENVVTLYRTLIRESVPFDILTFVYDIDSDTSLPYISALKNEDPRIVADKNTFGKGVVHALRWGFSRAQPGPVVVLMGDNSDKLGIIPEMIARWSKGATLVCPSRYIPGGAQHGGPRLKTFLSRLQGTFIKRIGFPTADPTNNFKLYDGTWLRKQTIESRGGFEVALELCYKAYLSGETIEELPTEWFDRTLGESRFKLWSWMPNYLRWYVPTVAAVAKRKFTG